jgi:hypothetical protein
MHRLFTSLAAATLLGLATSAAAFNSNVPASGLPNATVFSATLLHELDGVVPWKTLAQIEPVTHDGRTELRFAPAILALDQTKVRIQGFMLPMDLGDGQRHFLISAVPPHCPFCLPAGPDAIVEVLAKRNIGYELEPVVMEGKLAVLKSDPSGLIYRMTDAERVAPGRN